MIINTTIFFFPVINIKFEQQMEPEPESFKKKKQRKVDKQIYRIRSPIQQLQAIAPNTLDQGIMETLVRQVKLVCYKFGYVLMPKSSDDGTRRLRQWDLWGPFAMCLLFIFVINNSDQFITLLASIFIGAAVVSFNIRILGGQASLLQSISILGYCIVPQFIALILLQILIFAQVKSALLKFIVILVGTLWSVLACRAFISVNLPADRKFVALYPILLFYVFIGYLLFQIL